MSIISQSFLFILSVNTCFSLAEGDLELCNIESILCLFLNDGDVLGVVLNALLFLIGDSFVLPILTSGFDKCVELDELDDDEDDDEEDEEEDEEDDDECDSLCLLICLLLNEADDELDLNDDEEFSFKH